MRQKRPKPIAAFFPKLPQLLLAGAMFSAGLAACMGVSILVSLLTGFNNIILWGTGMIPGMIFYAGLVAIIRKYAIEGDYVPVIPTFVSAVRQNWKAFLLHGFHSQQQCGLRQSALVETILGIADGTHRDDHLQSRTTVGEQQDGTAQLIHTLVDR